MKFINAVFTQNSQCKNCATTNSAINVYKLFMLKIHTINPASANVTIMSTNPNGPNRSLCNPIFGCPNIFLYRQRLIYFIKKKQFLKLKDNDIINKILK